MLAKYPEQLSRERSETILLAGEEDKLRPCVEAADVICLTTNSSTPLFDGAWLRPGTCGA